MKTLFESQKDWDDLKGLYRTTYGISVHFDNESSPISFPCLALTADSVDSENDTVRTVFFIYPSDFQR
jgi:hypothetical protein